MSQIAARTVIAVLSVTLTALTADVGARGRNSELLVRIYDTGAASSGTRARAVWTDAELTSNRREDWLFAPSEQQQLQLGSVLLDDLSLTQ